MCGAANFILGGLDSRFGCGPCGLSGFASEAALHAVVLGTLQGAILIAVVICNFE